MADRKDREVGVDTTGTRHHSTETAVGDVKVFDAARKPDFAAQLFELPAQRADDQRQPIRAQMRPLFVNDRRLTVAIGEDFEHAERRPARSCGW